MSMVALATLSTASFAAGGVLHYSNGTAAQDTTNLVIGTEYSKAALSKDLNGTIDYNKGNNGSRVLVYTANVNKPGTASSAVSQPNVYVTPINGTFASTIDASNIQLVEVNASNPTQRLNTIASSGTIDGNGALLFASTSGQIQTGHTYALDNNTSGSYLPASLPITPASGKKITDVSFDLQVISSSGTIEVRDDAKSTGAVLKPQYTVMCAGKLDGMINFENGRKTFVTTGHGADDQNVSDQLLFDVNNDKAGIDYTMDENITINAVAVDTNLTDITASGTDVNATFVPGVNDANITITTTSLVSGLNHYAVDFNLNANGTLAATKFKDVNATFENNTTVEPASYEKGANLGQWQDYTYVAQIPAATADSAVDTKIFIVNRSCSNVMPTFRVIKGGIAQDVPASAVSNLKNFTTDSKIAVDAQGYVFVSDILKAANAANPSIPTTGKCAIEIVMPGIAESFYVTAQAKNKTLGQFKVLPVYNTSVRD